MENLPKKVAVMGCFRSGTNFAKTLLEQNFYCHIRNNVFGWKHGYLPIISPDSDVTYTVDYEKAFFITKNPFSFVTSLFNYHIEVQRNLVAPRNFEQFLRSRITMYDQAQENSVQVRFANPIELWNSMNWNYASHKDFIHIRYDKLILDPEGVCTKAGEKLSLKRKSDTFFVPEKKVKRINDGENVTHANDYMSEQNFNIKHYTSHQYMEIFNQSTLAFVKTNVDDELIKKLGYVEIINDLVNLSN